MNKYDDIINLERPNSLVRKRAKEENRAAQFAPFSALAGYEDFLAEVRRITEKKKCLADNCQEVINARLYFIKKHIERHFIVCISYFVKDEKKQGGSYQKSIDWVRKIDEVNRVLTLASGKKIMIDDIENITGEVFNLLDV